MKICDELISAAKGAGLAAKRCGVLLSVAESCTGGLIAAALTDLPGSSAWFCRGFVCYSNNAKMELLGVPLQVLQKHGAVSEETAAAMCKGAGDFSLSVTGIAGPDSDGEKAVGTVCFGFCCNGKVRTETKHFNGDRQSIRLAAARHALQTMEQFLREDC